VTSGQRAVTVTKFAAVTSGSTVSIGCTYLTGPAASTADVIASYAVKDDQNPRNELQKICATNPQAIISAATTTTKGTSSNWTHSIMPNNISQTNVNGTFKFKLTNAIPKGTEVTIAYPTGVTQSIAGTDLSDYVWSTVTYSACIVSSNGIKLTTAEDVASGAFIELFIDEGFDTPSTTTQSTNGFDVTASWNTLAIIDDLTQTEESKFTAVAAFSGTISSPTIAVDTLTVGESAAYTFSFVSSDGYTVGDMFKITFPREYDLFVGDAGEWFSEEANVYYMDCSSTALGACWCTVDKRVVTVSGSVDVAATGTIDITIAGVHNPSTAISR
jgi:hypothetical protein